MSSHQTMKSLPAADRPYEKCLTHGAEVLTDRELLAVILRTGSRGVPSLDLAQQVLELCPFTPGLAGLLHLSAEQLQQIPGIGVAKAAQIRCIGELSRRIATRRAKESLSVSDPSTVAEYYMETLRHEEQEHLVCMMLDAGNHFLGDVRLTSGTVNASLISPREIFLAALAHHAVGLILVHNHPSGDCTPSQDDLVSTERVYRAGELLGIRLVDHIIIGDRRFASLSRMGRLQGEKRGR